ncbi:MinD/ParA family protein [Tumidithrix elongata RA019]|uniref:MinD/ParA family protein n=1 Tax=Tumidithrix elongata BACA0141 TaxID=2716417 RepID=A0AAW9PR13_9CYAN|nr:MinD/ParA family protein [Tumidithrix elongata RA019]
MSKIISVHSFRGGTGKSNATANLAVAIACQGKRVGIIDTDIQSPGIHVLFGLDLDRIEFTLNSYLWGNCSIDKAAYDVSPKEVQAQNGCVFFVPSSIKMADISKILREGFSVEILQDGFEALIDRLGLDYLFIDTHPGLNEETLLSITMSDILVLLMRPDQQDFQGTAVTIDVARKLGVSQMLVVINRMLPSFDQEMLKARIKTTYQVPVAGVLPNSEDMMLLASNGLFLLLHPNHPLSLEYQAIANLITA